MTSNWPTLTR